MYFVAPIKSDTRLSSVYTALCMQMLFVSSHANNLYHKSKTASSLQLASLDVFNKIGTPVLSQDFVHKSCYMYIPLSI